MLTEVQGYIFTQTTASDTWVIKHNLNCKPVIQVFVNYGGKLQRVIPLSIVADDLTQVTVKFSVPQTGHANLQ